MANKIRSASGRPPPPASPRSPAAFEAAPEVRVWSSLRPANISPRPVGRFGRSGSKPRARRRSEAIDFTHTHTLPPPAPLRGRRSAMETRLVGTFPTGNGRSRFLFVTSRADFSVVCVSCATNLQSFGSSPSHSWLVLWSEGGLWHPPPGPGAGSRVALRRCPPVTADVSILTRGDIRHPQSHLVFPFRLPPLSLFLYLPRRFPPNRFVIPPPVGGDAFRSSASFAVISRPPTSSHQQIQTFPPEGKFGGEKSEKASDCHCSMLIHANAIESLLKILKVRSQFF